MFTFSPITVAEVSSYESDEVHITGKFSDNPVAVLSFVPVHAGVRMMAAPVAVVTLRGAAYNEWYNNWNGEPSLYTGLLDIYQRGVEGIQVAGVDMTKLATSGLAVTENTPEVLAAL